MSRLSHPLKKYKKAVEQLAEKNGVSVTVTATKGSIVRFELFEPDAAIPMSIWVIHHSHNKKKEIWSKEDCKKAARNLCCTYEEFVECVRSI